MPYMVTCKDNNGPYGPFPEEDAAHRYAALLDIDPACRDDRHEVSWCTAIKAPEPYGELQKAVLERIRKEGWRARRRCVNCETPLRECATPSLDGRGLCCSVDCAGSVE